MSLIKLSNNTTAWLLGGDLSNGEWQGPFCASSGFSSPKGFNYSNNSRLRIFKGALPSQNDLDTINPASLRTTDLLITFATINNWSGSGTSPIISLNIPLPTAATGSGVASWFLASSYDSSTVSYVQSFGGQITLPGGGGELVINDLNIVSGTTYSLGSISFKFPSTFSYP